QALAVAQQNPWIWFAVTLGLGALLGGMAAALLGRTFRLAEAWAVMLGMSMLAIGTASRLGLAGIAAMFVMGTAISALSPRRAAARPGPPPRLRAGPPHPRAPPPPPRHHRHDRAHRAARDAPGAAPRRRQRRLQRRDHGAPSAGAGGGSIPRLPLAPLGPRR